MAAAGGLAGLGGGFLGGGHRPGGGVHLGLGDGGGGQCGRMGMVGGAADRAGAALGQVFGQQPGPLGVQAAQQSGVAGGCLVRLVLGVQIVLPCPGGVGFRPLHRRQFRQAGGAGVQKLPGHLRLGLQPGQLGLGGAEICQRGFGFGQRGGNLLQRCLGLRLAAGSRPGGAAGLLGQAAGLGQRLVAGQFPLQRVQPGVELFQLGAAGLGGIPGGSASGQRFTLGGQLPPHLVQLPAQLCPAAGGLQRRGGFGQRGVQCLHRTGGFSGGSGVRLDQGLCQLGGLGGLVGVPGRLQGGQHRRFGGLGGGLQVVHVQNQRVVGPHAGFFRLPGMVGGGVRQFLVAGGAEDLPQNFCPVGGRRIQQPGKVVLGQHRHLGKLLGVNAQQRRDGRRHLPHAGDGRLRFPHQFRLGGHIGDPLAPGLATGLLRGAGHGILPPGMLKGQPHIGGGGRVGKVAAQHRRLPVGAGDLAVQRKGDGVKQRGLARAGVAGNQKQPALPEGGKIQHRLARIGPEGAEFQHQRPHAPTSSRRVFRASCSAWLGARPWTVSKKSANSSSKLRRRTASAVRAAGSAAALRGA